MSSAAPDRSPPPPFLAGGGEATRLILARDWSRHPLGVPETWPDAMRVAIGIVLNSPEAMILAWGPELHFFFNDAYAPLLEARARDAMGARFAEVWRDVWEGAQPIIAEAMAGRATRHVDLPWPGDPARAVPDSWWTISLSRVPGADGEPAGLFVVVNNTTDRVLGRAAGRRNRQIIDSATDHAVIATDLDGKVIRWSEGARRVLGWTEAEMLERTAHRIFTPEDVDAGRPEHEMRCALDTGSAADERWHLRKDGERFWASGELTVLRGEDGAAAGFVKVLRDRTEQRLAAERLQETAEELERAQEAGGVGVFSVDAEGSLRGSPQFQRLFGVADADARDSLAYERLVLPDDAGRMTTVAGRLSGNVPHQAEYRIRRADTGELRWIARRGEMERDADGGIVRFVGVARDITDQVATRAALTAEREQLAQMFEQAPTFMAILRGPEHRFERVNPGFLQLTGREVVGQTVRDALPDAAEQGFVDILDQVYRTGEPFEAHGTLYQRRATPDLPAEPRFLDFVYQPLRDAGGAVSGIFVEGVDVTDRVAAQRAAEATETQFRTLAQALPNQVWTARPDGFVDWLNARVVDYSGEASDTLVRAGWTTIVHPDDREGAGLRWAASLASGEDYETEFRIRRGDGAYRWHLVRALPIHDGDGRILRWVGTNTDIHEQKSAAVATRQDRDRLWQLSGDLMLVCDDAGRITAVNPSVTRLLGWAPDEVVGRSVAEMLHPDDVAPSAAQIDRVRGGEPASAFENRCRTKDGAYRLLQWSAVPDGKRIHAVGRDITDQRALARDAERIWTLSPVLKVVTDRAGVIAAINPSWTRALGWSAEDTVGRPTASFMVPDGQQASYERVARLGTGEALAEYRTDMLSRSGERRIVAWTSVPENDKLYGFGRDITAEVEAAEQLRAAEDALRQSQKMEAVGQLTGGIAHDFNNLLQGITGSLEIIQRRVAQGRTAEIDRFIAGATTAANRAAALTHRLLAFSRRQPLDPRPVRVNPLVSSMEDLLRRTIGERIELELVLGGGLWLTLCDPNQLENAILNLAINARDAMPEGGRLVIETANAHLDAAYASGLQGVNAGQYVCLAVTDTGTGMDAGTIAKAFEPFFTTKPIGQGTGLGLSMIYGFARQSEGHAKIYSESGQGTTFKLYLPRHRGAAEAEEEAPARLPRPAADDGEVVLVVEDEPVVRGLIAETLAELGYAALEAADGPEGLAVLQSKRRIDLLITDIGLPGLNGRQVADAARALRPDLKVLFMTGYAENAALASGFLEPGMAMITKPFAMDALAGRIRGIIEGEESR